MVESKFGTDPNEPTEFREYDAADNLTSVNDRNGLIMKMEYDAKNRLIHQEVDMSNMSSDDKLSSYTHTFVDWNYDATGQIIRHENKYCSVITKHDSRGYPILETIKIKNISGAPPEMAIVKEFDLEGKMSKLVYPSGRTISYTYDLTGKMKSIKNEFAPNSYPGNVTTSNNFEVGRYIYSGSKLVQTNLGNGLVIRHRLQGYQRYGLFR